MKKHTFKKLVGIGLASALALSSLTMMASAADLTIPITATVSTVTMSVNVPTVSAAIDVYNINGNGQVYLTDGTNAVDAAVFTNATAGTNASGNLVPIAVGVAVTSYTVDIATAGNGIVLLTSGTIAAPTATVKATKGVYLSLNTTTAPVTDADTDSTYADDIKGATLTSTGLTKAATKTATTLSLGDMTCADVSSVATPNNAVGFTLTGAANSYFTEWAATDAVSISLVYTLTPKIVA